MANVNPNLKYLGIEDFGDSYELTVQDSEGSVVKKQMRKYFKGHGGDLSEEYRQAILHRNFDFKESRTLVVKMSGGIGDILVSLETVIALKERIRSAGGTEFVWVGSFRRQTNYGFFSRFLNAFPIFDWMYAIETAQPIRFPIKILTGASTDIPSAHLSIGSAWDLIFAKWGVPGKYQPATVGVPGTLAAALDKETERLQASTVFPRLSRYILLAPESNYLGDLKAWPEPSWKSIQGRILDETPYDILFLGRGEGLSLAVKSDRVFPHDYETFPQPNDFLTLLALIWKAAAVVALDSGPAHAAGFLKVPCIALFGPTSPMFYGHHSNTNIRLSICPPCSMSENVKLCTSNICMQEIQAADVFSVLSRQLRRNVGD